MLISSAVRVLAAGAFICLFGAISGAASAAPAPVVVVSINPLHSLASAVMASVAKPVLLLPGASSPHGWALRPSQARAIHQADLVVWVGPALERSLARSLLAGGQKENRFEVMDLPGLTLLGRRVGDKHHHEGHKEHDDHENAPNADPHLWLNPENAMLIVSALADRLASIDADNNEIYASNAKKLLESLRLLSLDIRRDLAVLQDQKLVVYHDGFQYFERYVGLGESIVLTEEPEQPRSVGQLSRLAGKLDGAAIRCLFAEPQFDGRMARVLAQRYDLALSVIDPLGSVTGVVGYQTMMRGLTRAILDCGPAR